MLNFSNESIKGFTQLNNLFHKLKSKRFYLTGFTQLNNLFHKLKSKRFYLTGFTLVEMMVVLAIFGILIVSIVGIFVSAVKTQKFILATNHLIDQTSYAMEYMGRAARMAIKAPDSLCISSGQSYNSATGLKFINSNVACSPTAVCKTFNVSGVQLNSVDSCLFSAGLPLISSKLQVSTFIVNIIDGLTSGTQPKAKIFMEIKPVSDPKPTIKIQTTVSQRNLNF